jgi:hypothetical protein
MGIISYDSSLNPLENIHKTTKDLGSYSVGQVAGGDRAKEYEDFHTGVEKSLKPDREEFIPGENAPSDEAQAIMNQQQQLIAELQRQASGQGAPSAAQAQLQQATDSNMRQSLAMASSGRGNPALAMQAADRNRAIASQQGVAQSASLMAQEKQQATANLLNALGQASNTEMGQSQLGMQADQATLAQINANNARKDANQNAIANTTIKAGEAYFKVPPGTTEQVVDTNVTTPTQTITESNIPIETAPGNMALTSPQPQPQQNQMQPQPMMQDPMAAQMMAFQQYQQQQEQQRMMALQPRRMV